MMSVKVVLYCYIMQWVHILTYLPYIENEDHVILDDFRKLLSKI